MTVVTGVYRWVQRHAKGMTSLQIVTEEDDCEGCAACKARCNTESGVCASVMSSILSMLLASLQEQSLDVSISLKRAWAAVVDPHLANVDAFARATGGLCSNDKVVF